VDELIRQLKQIYVLLDDSERRALRSVGVTPTQVGVLRAVARHDGGLSVTALSRELLCSRGNATRLVQRMEGQGLLSATGHDRDQRLVLVRITDEGQWLLTRALTALSANSARLKDHLPPGHLDRIQQVSGELVAALEHRLAEVLQPDGRHQSGCFGR